MQCHILFWSIYSSSSKYVADAEEIYSGLCERAKIIEEEFGEGMSKAGFFGYVILNLTDKERIKLEKEALPSIRLLPLMNRFTGILNDWSKDIVQELSIMDNFISTPTVIFLSLLLDRMPNLTAAIHRYAALGPLPESQLQGMALLTEKHIQAGRSHHNMIVNNALNAIAAVHNLDLAVTDKITDLRAAYEVLNVRSAELSGKRDRLEKENGGDQLSDVKRTIRDTMKQQDLLTEQIDELSELRQRKLGELFVAIDGIVEQHEAMWQSHQQVMTQNLVEQLQKLHGITLTQEELASFQVDDVRTITSKREELEKNKISAAKKATDYEVLVHHIIWQWLSRSLKPIEEEPKIFKSLAPYLKQAISSREQLQKEIEDKYAALKNDVENQQKALSESDEKDG